MRRILALLLLCAACAAPSGERPAPAPALSAAELEAYVAEITEHRAQREQRLRAEGGWLTVVGLDWLQPGPNRFGSDPSNEIVLTGGEPPAHAGTLHLEDGVVRLEPVAGSGLTVNGEPVEGNRVLRDDNQEELDRVGLGRLQFYVIKRDDRYGVRVKDPQSPARTEFRGIDYFEIDPAYRIETKLERFDEPRKVAVPNVLGQSVEMLALGLVNLSIAGEEVALLPLVGDPEETSQFFIFKDGTSGKESYGAARYLYADVAEDDSITIDFNRAYNPPCAFTPHATCPLPPVENRLALRIEAGERYGGH
jgi:uncharacterized protein (DUF1684 family)